MFREKWMKAMLMAEQMFGKGKKEPDLPTCCVCPEKIHLPLHITVLGQDVTLDDSEMCEKCATEFLNKNSTLCAVCEGVILPGENVGRAPIGAKHEFVHLTMECTEVSSQFCGTWGEGRLISFHESMGLE